METSSAQAIKATVLKKIDNGQINAHYVSNRAPLQKHILNCPWVVLKRVGGSKKHWSCNAMGLPATLGEISIWLSKTNNAWLNKGG
jgi:hypothetical protein